MMKLIFMMIFLMFMLVSKKNKMLSLYYNILFFLSFIVVLNYTDKFLVSGWIYSKIFMGYFGVDNYSMIMIMLSMWILGLMLMSLDMVDGIKINMFMILLLIFIGFFSSISLIMFYLLFEMSLIPTFFLIIYWGMNPERLMASMYLMMYTLFISFPLMIYLFWLFKVFSSFNMVLVMMGSVNYMLSFCDYLIIMGAFLIKLPIYIFHIWLPKAHVEAPVYGSMVLAAVLLKLGTYGLVRIMMMFIKSCLMYNYLVFSVSIIGSLVVSILCLVQIDLKSLVAYSSVVHMNFLLCAMLTMEKVSMAGSLIMMVGHGLCSSGLFFMVNIYYMKTWSRIIFFNKGFMSLIPSYSLMWFLMCSSNFSYPFSLNFFGEILMISGLIMWSSFLVGYIMLICFFSSAYSLYLFSYIQHGSMNILEKVNFSLFKDFMIIIIHLYPLVLILMNLALFY